MSAWGSLRAASFYGKRVQFTPIGAIRTRCDRPNASGSPTAKRKLHKHLYAWHLLRLSTAFESSGSAIRRAVSFCGAYSWMSSFMSHQELYAWSIFVLCSCWIVWLIRIRAIISESRSVGVGVVIVMRIRFIVIYKVWAEYAQTNRLTRCARMDSVLVERMQHVRPFRHKTHFRTNYDTLGRFIFRVVENIGCGRCRGEASTYGTHTKFTTWILKEGTEAKDAILYCCFASDIHCLIAPQNPKYNDLLAKSNALHIFWH